MESVKAKVHELDLHGKKLLRIKGVNEFKHLHSLDASCNKLTRIQGLDRNKELRELKLYGNEITVIEGLDQLVELCVLLLQHNHITDIGSGLSSLKKLKQLRLDNNCLTTVTPGNLSSCGGHMTHLDLSHNRLTSVTGLGSLGSLEELKLAGNRLMCPPDLARCRKLMELDLSGNPLTLTSLSPALKPLGQLRTLRLENIDLCDLSVLPKLASLDTLHLADNRLTELHPLSRRCPRLEVLDLRRNSLTSVTGAQELTGLTEVLLEGNPLCRASTEYRQTVLSTLPCLETIDGVCVSQTTPTRSHAPSQLQPTTSSSIGPTLRQMEHHFLEAELQLEGVEGEISARFDLTRTKMEATIKESEVKLRDGEVPPQEPPYENVSLLDEVTSRPSTRSGSRSKLSEALVLADLYSGHKT